MIGLIVNPNARGVRRARGLDARLRALVGPYGEVVVTHSRGELRLALRRFAARKIRVLAACGGDGTNHAALTEAVRLYRSGDLPTLAFLPAGTVNTIASNLGIRGDPERLLGALVERALSADEIPTFGQDLLAVNGRYGFLCAAAMGARFLEAYYDGPRVGTAWAVALAARTIGSALIGGPFARWLFTPFDAAIEVDGARVPLDRVRILVAATVPDVGLGMRVAWQAGRQPARLHLVASALSASAMARQLPRILAGQPLVGNPHLDRLAKRVEIRFARPESYTLDGELFRARTLTISVGPRIWIAQALTT